ncbi:MAG: MotA/TolQ/ExbB proton channel family protein [Candidatus Omnitrophica bacterium]|nr:MotA/TolQ/ExbB proton channel family protein [Candidatus Omnitrophota bacterium]
MGFALLLKSGGVTIIVLIACSIFSLAIIIERLLYFKSRSKVKRINFMKQIKNNLQNAELNKALEVSEAANTPFSQVVHSGLKLSGHNETVISNAMEREITVETNKLERNISITGTIGSIAVYIGLFGTVLGIIRAFHDISSTGSGELNVVTRGIAEALVCTAAGLAVAVPAVIFYNYFIKKIDDFIADMELSASEVMDLMNTKRK